MVVRKKRKTVGLSLFRTAQDPTWKTHGASLSTGKTSESTPNNLSVNRNNFSTPLLTKKLTLKNLSILAI